jgi:ribose transport system substrate-binding protein
VATASVAALVKSLCPTHPVKVGFVGGPVNPWSLQVQSNIGDVIKLCPNVTEYLHTNASSLAQATSELNGYVTQGVNILIVQPEFGAAQLTSYAAAVKDGVIVVPELATGNGTLGVDYQTYAVENYTQAGVAWAQFLHRTVKTGKVVFLGGPPGTGTSYEFLNGLKNALKSYPGLHLVQSTPVWTDWTASGAESAMSGLLSKYGRIPGVVSDYGLVMTGVVNAYKLAGMAQPDIATIASAEINACQYQKTKFGFYTLGASTLYGVVALLKAFQLERHESSPPVSAPLPAIVDTASGQSMPSCQTNISSDEPLTAVLPLARQGQAEVTMLKAVGFNISS